MDIFLVLIGCYVVFAVTILYTLLLGQSEFHRDGCVGSLYIFLTSGLQDWCVGFFARCCPKKLKNGSASCYNYFMYKPNRILQGFYLTLVLSGFYFFYYDCFPYIGGPYISSNHKYGAFFAISFTLFTFVLSSNSTPGYINDSNYKLFKNSYPYDRYLYIKKNCESCNFIKPARSKHCRVCDKCVGRFDHHCPWINNCVGENNLRYFLLFVFSTSMLCMYGAYLCGFSMYSFMKINDVKNLGYTKDGVWTPIPTAILLKYIAFESRSILPLGAFCFVISLFLFYFFFYHIWLISKNTTTNESYKWQDIKDQIKIERLKQKIIDHEKLEKDLKDNSNKDKKDKIKKDNNKKDNNKDSIVEKVNEIIKNEIGDSDEEGTNLNKLKKRNKRQQLSSKESKDKDEFYTTLPLPKTFKELKNIYNKGLISNLLEVLLPKKV
ncbi:hypothetical protein ACTFIY_004907 [Dictyostelium cf. discoideum]